MTIACEKKKKPSDQMETVLNTDFTNSAEPIMDLVENGVPSRTPLPAKDATSSRKSGMGRQMGHTQDSFYPASNYYSYYYPGYTGAFGLWDDRFLGAHDGLSMAPQPCYHFLPAGPSGLVNFYCPAGMYPSSGYQKHGQFQNGRPMVHKSKGRMWKGRSRYNSREKSTRKGDCEATDELTCGPRVNERSDSLNSESEPSGVSGIREKYNVTEFQIEYENAKFYVIKSYSEDDIHRCIKYNVWSSTPDGNKRLDAAFHDAEVKVAESGKCPVFLFFSVNASGQFVGLAEMIGKVNFNQRMDFWQVDKWSGCFPVKWHIIKDIPNTQLRHILLENNGKRPVTFTRDTQEIGIKEGLEMLKIFKGFSAKSSVLDDFDFYENREKELQAKKSSKPAAHQTEQLCSEDLQVTDKQNSLDGGSLDVEGLVETGTVSSAVSPLVDLTKNLTIN